MNTVITRMLIAVALAVAAWLSWSESKLAARVADARQDIATFDHDNLDAITPRSSLSDYLPGNAADCQTTFASPRRRLRTGSDVTALLPRIRPTAKRTPRFC